MGRLGDVFFSLVALLFALFAPSAVERALSRAPPPPDPLASNAEYLKNEACMLAYHDYTGAQSYSVMVRGRLMDMREGGNAFIKAPDNSYDRGKAYKQMQQNGGPLELIRKALGVQDLAEVFHSIEPESMSMTWLCAVHKAWLKPSAAAKAGVESDQPVPVVVKVQMPGVHEFAKVETDFWDKECHGADRSDFNPPWNGHPDSKFNYTEEAVNLNRARRAVLRSPHADRVVVPRAYEHLSSEQVVVMDFLQGSSLAHEGWPFLEGMREIFGMEPVMVTSKTEALRALLKPFRNWKKVKFMARKFVVSPIARFWYENVATLPFKRDSMPALLDLTVQILGYQIFEDGLVNTDPHPGNQLILRDGKMGLLDYGTTYTLTLRERVCYARLLIAISGGDKQEAVRLATGPIGLKTKFMDHDMIWTWLLFQNDRDTDDVTGGRDIQQFQEWAFLTDPLLALDEGYFMCGKVSLFARGFARAYGMELRVADRWRPIAQELLDKHDPGLCS